MDGVPADHDISIYASHRRSQAFDEGWAIGIVGIKKRNCLASRDIQTDITRHAESAILLMDDAEARIPFREIVANLPRAICGTVIDDDHLKVAVGLGEDAVQSLNEVGTYVVHWNNHADEVPTPSYPLT